jgi:DNA primase
MEHLGMGFVDAVSDLSQAAGLTVPKDERSPEERERFAKLKEHQVTLSDVLKKASDHYRTQLKSSARAIDYLKRRGLSGEIAARFAMGYAPEGWRALASAFAHYDDPLLEESGLVISQPADQEGSSDVKRYDRFRDRIMFPIRSVQGEVVGFGGRVLDQGEPKYLNSPETPVFSKGRELYGLFEARSAIRQSGFVLVVEGYMDVVALAQLGFPNAVATLGTACTAEHVQKLFRFTESVVFSFDGDAAGRRAAGRALEAALPHASDTRTVRFLFLPAEHDPDSYVREFGTGSFEQCVQQAVPLSRQLINIAQEGCDMASAEGRARFLAMARPLWSGLPEGALKRQLLGDLAVESRLDSGELSQMWQVSMNTPRASSARGESRSPRPVRKVRQGAANHLDRALWLLMQRPEMWWELDSDAHDLLADQAAPYGSLFGCLERTIHEQGALSPTSLSDEFALEAQADAQAQSVVERIAGFHPPEAITDLKHQLILVLDHLRLRDVDSELSMLFESGVTSPDIQTRSAELLRSRTRLRARLAETTPLQW